MTLEARLRTHREARGIGQSELAQRIGISRQALAKLESGVSQPSVMTALLLARELECSVEQLFALAQPARTTACEGELEPGQRVIVGRVAGRWVAHAIDELEGPTRADGVVRARGEGDTWRIEHTREPEALVEPLLIAGCAPSLGLLVELARERGLALRWLPCDSGRALELCRRGLVHLAGMHLYDSDSGQYNAPQARRALARPGMLALTRWSAGLALAPGNPLGLRKASDLRRTRASPRVATRQPGSGAAALLDRHVGELARPGPRARSHRDVARLIVAGAADVGVTIEPVARAAGLEFMPLADECFDLVGPAAGFDDPRIEQLSELLALALVQAELAPFPGEDTRDAGRITLLG